MNWREFQSKQKIFQYGSRFVSFVDEGSGDPVILLHGMPGWGYLWQGIYPALARSHRVLIPDLMGFGYSDRSDRFDRSIARQAEMIDAWMEFLSLPSAAIVGHDLGGGIALRLATLYSDRISRLCLMDSVCYDNWPVAAMQQLAQPQSWLKTSVSNVASLIRQGEKSLFAGTPDEEFLDGLNAPYTTEVGKISLVRNAAALDTNHTTEITPLLSRIEAPTMILWGDADDSLERKFAERLAIDIPNAKLAWIEGAKHFPMVDRPAQVTTQLSEFLA